MLREKRDDELLIYDEERLILIHMARYKLDGWDEDEDGRIIEESFEYDKTQIEFSYREEDREEWGAGADEFVSIDDIKAMADCVRKVINKQVPKAEYSCQDDVFIIKLAYDKSRDKYSFSAALIETLMWKYHIRVEKSNLSLDELEEYTKPILLWEEKFCPQE